MPTSVDKIASWLANVPLLAKLSSSERSKLAAALTEQQYAAGNVVFRQGDVGSGFYIVISGAVDVSKDGVQLATLRAGDYFGEQALISNVPRAATCSAATSSSSGSSSSTLRVFYMPRELFDSMFGHSRLNIQFVKRTGVSAETSSITGKRTASQLPAAASGGAAIQRSKTPAVIKLIQQAMSNNVLFMNIDAEHKQLIIDAMQPMSVPAGSAAVTQGDYGDNLYVVESGSFDVTVGNKHVATRGPGTCFGELALMYNARRAATVRASSAGDAIVWYIDRFTFRRIVTDMSERRFAAYCQFLRGVQLLAPLAEYERRKVAEALDEVHIAAGTVVFRQGDSAVGGANNTAATPAGTMNSVDAMYIVHSGEIKLTRNDAEIMRVSAGGVFGERALHTAEPRAATAVAVTACTLLRLDRTAFTLLLGPLEDIMKQKVVEYKNDDLQRQATLQKSQLPAATSDVTVSSVSSKHKQPAAAAVPAQPAYVLPPKERLRVIGTLGKGSFGFVQLVQDPVTSMTYALKAVNKTQIVATGQQHHVMNEKHVMSVCEHPFLIRLYGTYKDTNRLYFLLQPSLGGELFSVLRERTLFDEDTARFYAAQVVLAFAYMHDVHNCVYRDLKPENLLLDASGYLKITDFGFAKRVLAGDRTFTLCGTPDYLAPEIVSGRGHGRGVDWWTLGIFVYEMLASYPPFYDEDPMKTYSKIMAGQIHYPSHFSADAISLITALLQPRVSKRLGMLAGGADDIKAHPWFKRVDWQGILNKKVRPPIVPKIKSELDTSNFDAYASEQQQVVMPYVDDGSHWEADF